MPVVQMASEILRAATRDVLQKMVFLKCSLENTCARVSFLIKLQVSACNFIEKETLVQEFSCEFCKISKNTFSYRTPSVDAATFQLLVGVILGCTSSHIINT